MYSSDVRNPYLHICTGEVKYNVNCIICITPVEPLECAGGTRDENHFFTSCICLQLLYSTIEISTSMYMEMILKLTTEAMRYCLLCYSSIPFSIHPLVFSIIMHWHGSVSRYIESSLLLFSGDS